MSVVCVYKSICVWRAQATKHTIKLQNVNNDNEWNWLKRAATTMALPFSLPFFILYLTLFPPLSTLSSSSCSCLASDHVSIDGRRVINYVCGSLPLCGIGA